MSILCRFSFLCRFSPQTWLTFPVASPNIPTSIKISTPKSTQIPKIDTNSRKIDTILFLHFMCKICTSDILGFRVIYKICDAGRARESISANPPPFRLASMRSNFWRLPVLGVTYLVLSAWAMLSWRNHAVVQQ